MDRAIIGFLSAAGLSVGMIYFQYNNVTQSMNEVEKRRSEFLSGNASVLASLDDSSFLESNYKEFKNVINRKSFDSRRKVEWINLLKTAKSQLDLAEMSFEIYPARSIVQNHAELLVSVNVEIIELKVSVLHDGKISELLSYLNTHAPNDFSVDTFDISRVERKTKNDTDTQKMINLEVLCTIKWYSLDMIGEGNDLQS